MAQIYLKYNPYKLKTEISINGKEILPDSSLYRIVKEKRMQEWIGQFPQMLVDELNTVDFDITFHGMPLDWDDFEDVFRRTKDSGVIKNLKLHFSEGKNDDLVNEKIVQVFTKLKEGPVDDFRDPTLIRSFDGLNNSDFPINVIATMSSGKSTLINALLGKKLMPSKNEACTATITEILDNDNDTFTAIACDENNDIVQKISNLTYDVMCELNDNEDVQKIFAEGNIPFLDAYSTALKLVDTPGPNNSQNQAHKNTTYKEIKNNDNNLILYVLNGTQLKTNDDASLLSFVAKQIKEGGKQVRDRFIFVVNKMDSFNPEEEDVEKSITAAKRYLASYGIENPQIFPCSAYTALNIKTYLKDIDIDNLTRAEERKLPSAARDTLPMIDKFIDYESMHLENYSTLSPSAQRDLNYRLSQAEKDEDTKEQALIHSGIYSVEEAITAYVKKYAKTKKIKDLVDKFNGVLESKQVLTKAKTLVASNEEAAEECRRRAEIVKRKIEDGKEAEIFKERIHSLDPMKSIEEKAETLKVEINRRTTQIFKPYGDTITNKEEAKRLVNSFSVVSSDCIAELTAELESKINQEVMETGEKILTEYQEKLSKIDDESNDKQLNFETADLIKGALSEMKDSVSSWCSDDFATETIDDVGETTYEEKVYYEKVGEEAEKVVAGTENIKVGTKKVLAGTHRVKSGTRYVRNPEKKWWKVLTPKYIQEDVYETVADYKDEDVYKTVVKYKTVMKDVFEERREQVENFKVETSVIQSGLISKLRRNIDEGIEDALSYASDQIETMKQQFSEIFDELDQLIKDKYSELEFCANDQKNKEEELESNKKILEWIETCKAEIDDILDI